MNTGTDKKEKAQEEEKTTSASKELPEDARQDEELTLDSDEEMEGLVDSIALKERSMKNKA